MIAIRTLLFALLLAAPPARGAELRPYVALADRSVRLSDLFAGLPPGADQAIGPAPAPGNRIIVPAAQLVAIAEQFGVDWHSASPADSVILERPGEPLASAALMAPLEAALADRGAPDHFEISFTGYAAPLVAPNDAITALIGSLDYNQGSGDFSALVTFTGRQTPAFSLRVSGNLAELASVPVLAHLLPAHQAIAAGDLQIVTLRLPRASADIARRPAQVIGQALRHVVPPGAALALSQLMPPQAVAANALVEMDLQTGGLSLQGRAIAEQSGAVGDLIRVRNPSSLAVMMAQITGPDQVRVDPESQPIVIAHSQEVAAR